MDIENSGIRFFYLLADLVLLNIAVYIVFKFSPIHDYMDLPSRNLYYLHANISEMTAYILYSRRNFFFTTKFIERLKMRSKRFIILIITLYALGELILPKGYHRIVILEYVAFFYIFKMISFYFIYRMHKRRYEIENYGYRVAVIGTNNSSRILGNLLKNNPRLGFKFIGYISDDENNKNDEHVLGSYEDIHSIVDNYRVSMIFVTNPKYFTDDNTKMLLTDCNKAGLRLRYILMNEYWSNRANYPVEPIKYFEMFNPQEIPLDHLTLRIQKRAFDIIFSSLVIMFIFSWLIPLLAIIIKMTSKGPVFFIQERTGINNKTFKCYKFRTMTTNKDCDNLQAQKNDARITKLGKFLRKTNLDEMPQFFNVLLGHMPVVGPRPHMLKHTSQYSALIEYYKVRHFVKPGITGWAQVNGFRGLTDELWKMERRVEHDMQYLEKWTLLWDIKIIAMTILGKDAYQNAM